MTGAERVGAAMRLERARRVPVMCQLAIGHYFLNTDLPREEIWFGAEGFCEALTALARRYRFDGVLVNLMPQAPAWRSWIERTETEPDGTLVLHWKQGGGCRIPPDDNLHHFPEWQPPPFEEVDPARLYYDDPHGAGGLKYPFHFGLEPDAGDKGDYFPDYLFRSVDRLVGSVKGDLSIHAEVFSPFTQLMELFGYSEALMRLVTDAEKCCDILARYAEGAADLAVRYARRGADAILVSSAFAGGGFISRDFYSRYVLPYERRVTEAVKAEQPGVPVYVHTCGAIGDRLELMLEGGYNGIDTLDPPPLGTVELADAVERLRCRAFIKGNMDPVGTLLHGDAQRVREDARQRILTAGPAGGYILSSACSVPPRTKPENLAALAEVADDALL